MDSLSSTRTRAVPRLADPRQQRIYERLLLIGQGPANFYMDYCELTQDPHFRSTSHIAAHLLREIESAVRKVLLPDDFRRPKGEDIHRAQINAIVSSMDLQHETDLVEAWQRLAGDDPLAARAHRENLIGPRPFDQDAQAALGAVEGILDALLARLEERFLTHIGVVDELLAKSPPTPADADRLSQAVPNNSVTLAHFFATVSDPAWLLLLRERGFFKYPPPPIADETAGTIQFPPWPQSQYLLRVAMEPALQSEVAAIALGIPATENAVINTDLAEIALKLPPDLAAPFAHRAQAWLEHGYFSPLPLHLGELVPHLASGDRRDEALAILRALLAPPAAQGSTEKDARHARRVDSWALEEILKQHSAAIIRTVGIQALTIFCDALTAAIAAERHEGDPGPDYSYVWRAAIEDHPENETRHRDIRDDLITAIRDGSATLAEDHPEALAEIGELFARYPWKLFRRLWLHLLTEVRNAPVELVERELHHRNALHDTHLWHEYARLWRHSFNLLPAASRSDLIQWLRGESAPPEEDEEPDSDSEDCETVAERERVRRWRQLSRFGDALPEELKPDWAALEAEFGTPEHPEFAVSSGETWSGPTSPRTADDLAKLSVDDLLRFLREWEPPSGFMVDTPEGLARELQRAIAAAPAPYVEAAQRFRELDKTYVRALVSGVEAATKAKLAFPWRPIVELAWWVVEQDSTRSGLDDWDRDSDWRGTRAAIGRLLETGLHREEHGVPFELRELAWTVISALAHDYEPTPEYEATYGGDNMRPYELCINTVRGVAVEAAIAYGLWVRRNLRGGDEGDQPTTFDDCPELRDLLQHHLEHDPSLAVRSAFGRWFPWLHLLDATWAAANAPLIFPREENAQPFRHAAWSTYVSFCRPYNNLLPVLREEYACAVKFPDAGTSSHGRDHSAERLAEHLMMFYLRGLLPIDDPILRKFFDAAPSKLRGHALEDIGRVLHSEGELANDVLDRALALWSWRFGVAAANPPVASDELESFGRWFAAERLDIGWRIDALLQALTLHGKSEPDHLVVGQLASVPDRLLDQAVRCLSLLVDGAEDRWLLHSWRKDIETLLTRALAQPEAVDRARALINRLAARGHLDYRRLLSSPST